MNAMNLLSYGGVKPMKKKLAKSTHRGVDGKKKLVKVAKKVKVVAKPTKSAKPVAKPSKPATKRTKATKMDIDKELNMSSLLKVLSKIKVTPLKKSSAEKMFDKMMSTFDKMGVKSPSLSPQPKLRKSTRATKPIQRLQY